MPRHQPAQGNPNSAANPGFEAQLWRAANALRGSIDAADPRHVSLSLITAFGELAAGATAALAFPTDASRAEDYWRNGFRRVSDMLHRKKADSTEKGDKSGKLQCRERRFPRGGPAYRQPLSRHGARSLPWPAANSAACPGSAPGPQIAWPGEAEDTRSGVDVGLLPIDQQAED